MAHTGPVQTGVGSAPSRATPYYQSLLRPSSKRLDLVQDGAAGVEARDQREITTW